MPDSIPPPLLNAANRKVFGCLADKSAHPDIADVLRAAVKPLGDVQMFCPDWLVEFEADAVVPEPDPRR